ncbi:L-2-hydroxyglutarate oxidase [Gandjariella thermophila]|uniref:L-2-hydroxyglutarate oxidase n=1 Tax=Gandjariella thermophila TaxID=1931992 RepID=UPI0010F44E38|nr:L-2-hydroxyglutarate oxidase [Gandjariella thermophila]
MRADIVIVGGGIVGTATAYALARTRPDLRVVLAEKESGLARHQTGHNSGVIHSGVYYRPGSLKARFATEGARRMAEFCAEHGLPHEPTGKVIVATESAELPRLHALHERGLANGIPVRLIDVGELREREPHVAGLRALFVPTAGICDFGAITETYAKLAADAGTEIWTSAEVTAITRLGDVAVVSTRRGDVEARCVVTCAGLHGDRVAALAGAPPASRVVPFRGEYYQLAAGREHLVCGLVYPVPDPRFPFLGVHLTRMIAGGVHAGPNAVLAPRREGYSWWPVDPVDVAGLLRYPGFWLLARRHWRQGAVEVWRSLSRRAFALSVARLVPEITVADLEPAPPGVRAQALLPDGGLADDFLIEESPLAVHVLNAPSPAATASLPIGEEIARRVAARF